jgi:hypothetical protein
MKAAVQKRQQCIAILGVMVLDEVAYKAIKVLFKICSHDKISFVVKFSSVKCSAGIATCGAYLFVLEKVSLVLSKQSDLT